MAKDAREPQSKPLNRSLHAAKATKQDEFYTQLSDIEKELKHYTAFFKGKAVLCNCDDPRVSNFFHFFTYNFDRKEMRGLAWGELYNKFRGKPLDTAKLEREIATLMMDEDVGSKPGIYRYVFDRDEKHLNIRAFSDNMKREAYEKQKGICAKCGEHFELGGMEADHVKPWHEGGKTNAANCQMLCKDDNRRKSGK